jgi:hypothetical protein
MQISQSNAEFMRMVQHIRRIMPSLAGILLVVVYAVSAVAGGMFLAKLMGGFKGGALLAYAIGTAIQATRATLVFFPQLNPTRPSFSLAGEFIAVFMGIIAIVEILSLIKVSGLPYPVGVSLSVLMLAGIGVELFLLREIRFATEIQLFGNRAYWQELKDYYTARAELKIQLDELKNRAAGISSPAASAPAPAAPAPAKSVPAPAAASTPASAPAPGNSTTPTPTQSDTDFFEFVPVPSLNGNGKHH